MRAIDLRDPRAGPLGHEPHDSTGAAWDNPVLRTEGRVTLTDGLLAAAVLLGLLLNLAVGWWWADPAAGYVLVYYAPAAVRFPCRALWS